MIGRPGRVLFRLLSECLSAWLISSDESLCTLGSTFSLIYSVQLSVTGNCGLFCRFGSSNSLIVFINRLPALLGWECL